MTIFAFFRQERSFVERQRRQDRRLWTLETDLQVNPHSPVACTIKVYNRKFMIANCASVCSIAYDRNL